MKRSSANHTIFRVAALEDVDRIISIAETVGLSRWSRDDYLAGISGETSRVSVAEKNGEVIGFTVGRLVPGFDAKRPYDIEIDNIGVDPRFQRKGVGAGLIRYFLASISDASNAPDVGNMWLEVRSSNVTAIRFYEKLGFREIHQRPNYYRGPVENAIVMKLKFTETPG